MKVKYFLKAFCGAALLVAATSCNDWLKEEEPGKSTPEDYFALGKAAIRAVNAAYTPLAWEFNSTYFSEWFIGDIASDDALKGGQNLSDMADAYDKCQQLVAARFLSRAVPRHTALQPRNAGG